MTVPSPPVPTLGLLGEPGPGQGALLVHFTGRPIGTAPNPAIPPAIAAMTPEQRLESILWAGAITGSSPFRDGPHTVSFSEVSPAHLQWLVHRRLFPPWGLVFDRQAVYAAGAGPVWHARPAQYSAAIAAGLAPWVVRLDTTSGARSEWMHEREWRVQADNYPATLQAGLVGLLVGHGGWTPARWLNLQTGRLVDAAGVPTDNPAQGLHPETREGWWLPPGGPHRRFLTLPDSTPLHELPPYGAPIG